MIDSEDLEHLKNNIERHLTYLPEHLEKKNKNQTSEKPRQLLTPGNRKIGPKKGNVIIV